jgi:nitrate/TMAO reductase-like tetraheme cytochrome c subunit
LTERELRHRPATRPWYRRTWFTWIVVIGIAAVVVAILVFPVAAMDDESYCTSCKAMKPAEKTLAASAHSGIDCTKCHIPPGVIAASRWRLAEARNVWADYLGMPSTAEKEHVPTNANCLECHPLSGIPNETAGVRMNHEEHLRLRNLLCVDCRHRLPAAGPKGVSMVTCAMCHNEQGCPTRAILPSGAAGIRHAPDFMKRRQAGRRGGLPSLPPRQEAFCDTAMRTRHRPTTRDSGATHGEAAADPRTAGLSRRGLLLAVSSGQPPSGWLRSTAASPPG